MAQKTYDLRFVWENNVSFTASSKEGDADWLTIVSLDENAHIKEIWGFIESICTACFNHLITNIGTEMKA